MKPDFDTVREIARKLPEVEDCTAYGSPALKVHGKLFTCLPTHKSTELGSLAVRIDIDRRTELLAAAPDVYYVTDHYLAHPMVLVRLNRIHRDALEDLLSAAWRFVAAKSPSRKRPPKPR